MNNRDRRHDLNEARENAVAWARLAQECTNLKAYEQRHDAAVMANMWANVAQALMTGYAMQDGVIE